MQPLLAKHSSWLMAAGVLALPLIPPPACLVVGRVSWPVLLLTVPLLYGVWWNASARLPTAAIVCLLLLLSLIFVSVCRSDNPDDSLSFFARTLFAILAGLVLAPHFSPNVLLLGTLARLGIELAAHFVQTGIAATFSAKLGDAGSHHLIVAGLVLPATIVAVSARSWKGPLGFLVGTVAILLTRSRAALLALGAGLAASAMTRSGTKLSRRFALALAGLAAILLTVVAIRLTWSDALRSLGPRAAYARAAIDATAHHPWLGLGWGGFLTETRLREIDPVAVDPHNLFLQIAVEAGVPAMLSFITLLWLLRMSTRSPAAIIAILVYSMFVSFYLDWPVFWVLLFARDPASDDRSVPETA